MIRAKTSQFEQSRVAGYSEAESTPRAKGFRAAVPSKAICSWIKVLTAIFSGSQGCQAEFMVMGGKKPFATTDIII